MMFQVRAQAFFRDSGTEPIAIVSEKEFAAEPEAVMAAARASRCVAMATVTVTVQPGFVNELVPFPEKKHWRPGKARPLVFAGLDPFYVDGYEGRLVRWARMPTDEHGQVADRGNTNYFVRS